MEAPIFLKIKLKDAPPALPTCFCFAQETADRHARGLQGSGALTLAPSRLPRAHLQEPGGGGVLNALRIREGCSGVTLLLVTLLAGP